MRSKIHIGLISLLAVVLLSSLFGCSRYVDSRDPVRSLPATESVPENLLVMVSSATALLSWEVEGAAADSRFRVYVFDIDFATDSAAARALRQYDTAGYEITIADLPVNQTYYFRVASLINGGLEGELSEAVSAYITHWSVVIEQGDEYTSSREARVQINSSGLTTHMILSEDSTFAGKQFEPFTPINTFTLSDGDGLKTVYVRLDFSDGTELAALLSDDIILDSEAEADSVVFIAPDTVSTGDTVMFYLFSPEIGGQASMTLGSSVTVPLYDDGSHADIVADDGLYAGRYVVPVNVSVSNGQVTGTLIDAAGNRITISDDDFINIYNTPLPVTLTTTALSTHEIVLNWNAASGSDFLAYRIYRSQTSPVTEASELLHVVSNRNTVSFTDSDLPDNTTFYYKVYAYHSSGLFAESNEATAVTLANTPPQPVVLSLTLEEGNMALLTWTASNENDFDYYSIRRDTLLAATLADSLAVSIANSPGQTNYTSYLPTDNVYYFQVFVVDRHGEAVGSNILSIQR
jgi:hypothetical protein